MNPLKWVRWKLLAVLVAVFALLYFLGIDPLARWRINAAGASSERARWNVARVGLGLLSGDIDFERLEVAQARERNAGEVREKVFNAAEIRLDLSVADALRRRFVVEEVRVRTPRMVLVRREDGTTNIEEITGAEEEAEAETPEAPPKSAKDWIDTAIHWYEKIREWYEKLPGRGEKPPSEEEERRELELKRIYERRVTYPFRNRPLLVVRRVIAEDLEIDIVEAGKDTKSPIPRIRNGRLELKELSDKPTLYGKPVELLLAGEIGHEAFGWGKISLRAVFDPAPQGTPFIALDVTAEALPAGAAEVFAGASLPVHLEKGTISLGTSFRLSLADDEGTFLEPLRPRLAFHGVRLKAKEGHGTIAGFPAQDFVRAFNEASELFSSEGEPLELADLEIAGSLKRPVFRWGETVRNLVTQGGRAFARKALAKVEERVSEEAAKIGGKIEEEAKKILEKNPELKGIKESIEKTIPVPGGGDLEDAAKKGFEALRGGLFGGGKKEEEGKNK